MKPGFLNFVLTWVERAPLTGMLLFAACMVVPFGAIFLMAYLLDLYEKETK